MLTYRILRRYLAAQTKEKIPGGLAKGIKVEMEHTEDEALAREIAMDHLTEDPAYYDKLEAIEK